MSRILRLFVCAAGMLAAAVLACLFLQDDDAVDAGSQVVSGRITGFEENVGSRDEGGRAVPVSSVAEREEQDAENRSGVARVKALELARAAADKHVRPADAPAQDEAEKAALPAAAPAVAQEPASEQAAPAQKTEPAAAEKAAQKPSSLPAQEASVQSAEKKAAPVKPAPRKAEAKKAEPRKAAAKKPAKEKAEQAKAKKPVRQLSAVEAALADARSGRLSPGDSSFRETDASSYYDREVTSAKFSMKGSLIKLVLRGNSPMIGHFYVLEDPDRVVLDLAGNWNIELPRVPSNRLIGAVRVGQHDDKTRLVFDMKEMGKVALVPLNRNALELRIQ